MQPGECALLVGSAQRVALGFFILFLFYSFLFPFSQPSASTYDQHHCLSLVSSAPPFPRLHIAAEEIPDSTRNWPVPSSTASTSSNPSRSWTITRAPHRSCCAWPPEKSCVREAATEAAKEARERFFRCTYPRDYWGSLGSPRLPSAHLSIAGRAPPTKRSPQPCGCSKFAASEQAKRTPTLRLGPCHHCKLPRYRRPWVSLLLQHEGHLAPPLAIFSLTGRFVAAHHCPLFRAPATTLTCYQASIVPVQRLGRAILALARETTGLIACSAEPVYGTADWSYPSRIQQHLLLDVSLTQPARFRAGN